MASKFEIRNTSGVDNSHFSIGNLRAGINTLETIWLTNTGTTTPTALRLTVANYDFTFSGKRNFSGQEVVDEKMVEAKIGAGAWTPIGGTFATVGNYIEPGLIAAGAYVEIELRLNIPVGASTKGAVKFVLCGANSDD